MGDEENEATMLSAAPCIILSSKGGGRESEGGKEVKS